MPFTHCTLSIVPKGIVTIHVVTSPLEGEMVNSLIVETPNALVVVDVPLLKPYALEIIDYITSLVKPVAMVLSTHAHPDHWFSLGYFKQWDIRAFAGAIEEMAALKDIAVGYHTSLHADLMPDEVILPPATIEPGDHVIDGVTFRLLHFTDVEANAMMAVELPDISTLLAQDLLYNHCYMYVASRTRDGAFTADNWIAVLEDLKRRNYETVIPGHGEPSDASLFDDAIAYLRTASDILAHATSAEEFTARFKESYPDYKIDLMLMMSAFMIYQNT